MASPFVNLDVSYDIEKEPNYLGFSRGIDVPHSLAQGDTSLGKLFGNVGQFVDDFARGGYANINEKIQRDARAGLEPIINEMGGDITPQEAPLIAGTGARGAKFQAASGVTGLNDSGELGMNQAKLPSDFQANVDRVKQLKSAFEAGGLSDTKYKTETATIFQRLRAQYGAAWSNEIDAAIREVNNTPANDVRKAVLNDLISMSAAQSSQVGKLMTMYQQDSKYWEFIEPGLRFEKFAADPFRYIAEANRLKSEEHALAQKQAVLANTKAGEEVSRNAAYSTYQTDASMHISRIIQATAGRLKQRGLELAQQGASANPQDLADFASQYQALRSVAEQQLDTMAKTPLLIKQNITDYADEGIPIYGGNKSYATYLKAGDIKEIKEQALATFDAVAAPLGIKDFTTANSAANLAKWQHDRDFLALTAQFPQLRALGAIKDSVGDQTMESVLKLTNGAVYPALTKAVTDTGWLNVRSTKTGEPPPPATAILGGVKGTNPPNPGEANRIALEGLKRLAQHEDSEVGKRAVESIFGDPKLFASTAPSEKAKLYAFLGSNAFTEKMLALKKESPEAWAMYSGWMEKNFSTVYPEAVADAASAINFKDYNWSMDPKTLQITATSKNPVPFGADPAPSYVAKINSVSQLIAPILKENYGEQAASKLLEAARINPNAPKTGSFFEELDKSLKGVTGAPLGARGEKRSDAGSPALGFASVEEAPQPTANAARTGATWGNPFSKTFKQDHLTDIQAPNGKTIQVNKVAAEAFQGFLTDLAATGYQIKDIGGYSFRENKSSPGRLSQHAYGNAIDINPSKNAFGSRKSDLPPNVGELADKWGLVWGGRWSHPDPMHFEYSGKKVTKKADLEGFLNPAG